MKQIFFLFVSCLFITNCGGGSSGDSSEPDVPVEEPIVLPQVTEYVLQNTTELLEQTTERLKNLSIDAFFDEAFLTISEREIEGAISDGLFDAITTTDPQLTLSLIHI